MSLKKESQYTSGVFLAGSSRILPGAHTCSSGSTWEEVGGAAANVAFWVGDADLHQLCGHLTMLITTTGTDTQIKLTEVDDDTSTSVDVIPATTLADTSGVELTYRANTSVALRASANVYRLWARNQTGTLTVKYIDMAALVDRRL